MVSSDFNSLGKTTGIVIKHWKASMQNEEKRHYKTIHLFEDFPKSAKFINKMFKLLDKKILIQVRNKGPGFWQTCENFPTNNLFVLPPPFLSTFL